jgi:homoserine kinase type II
LSTRVCRRLIAIGAFFPVYTTVSADDLVAWLTRYALGTVREFEPIVSGIENTNYFVTADNGRFVLTLYERLPAEELPFYLNLMAHLAQAGVEAPAPEPDRSGALWSFLNGKPAGLVARLDGAPVERPRMEHCAAAGNALARMRMLSQVIAALSAVEGPRGGAGRACGTPVLVSRAERPARVRNQVPGRLCQEPVAARRNSRRFVLRQRLV